MYIKLYTHNSYKNWNIVKKGIKANVKTNILVGFKFDNRSIVTLIVTITQYWFC